jgi:hypothetical protein
VKIPASVHRQNTDATLRGSYAPIRIANDNTFKGKHILKNFLAVLP